MYLKNTVPLADDRVLYAYWANNKGRGRNNCTLIVCPKSQPRTPFSSGIKNYDSKTRTSSWQGDVNLSQRILGELNLKKEDLISAAEE